jgi:exosortase K
VSPAVRTQASRREVLGLGAWDAAAVALVLALAYALKSFASRAGARELDWLLGPTAALVTRMTGHAFSRELGAGYTSRELFVVIAPVCSGANFAIIAFSALACSFVVRFTHALGKLAWVAACVPVAYAATVLANALRITLALEVARPLATAGFASPENAHRAVGVVVYLGCLLALHALFARLLDRHAAPGRLERSVSRSIPGSAAVPIVGYVVMTVVTPLLRGVSGGRPFAAHAGMVLGAAGLAGAVLWVGSRLGARYRKALARVADGTMGSGAVAACVVTARRSRQRSLPG